MAGDSVRGPGGPETGRGSGARRDGSALESGPADRLGDADLRPPGTRPAPESSTGNGNRFYLRPS